jgi:hypothetical protein
MILSENIAIAYHSRAESKAWSEWAQKNPAMEKLLNEAEVLCQ